MKTHRLLISLLLAALCAAAAAAAPLRVLILTGQNNHDWKATTPVLKDILERTGRFAVDVTEDPSRCDAATFAQYDALLTNYNGPRWGETADQALLEYVRGGGGFVVIHAANNAFGDWPEYDRLIGGAWRAGAGHGDYYRYAVTIADPDHPITRGMVDFLHAPDELYHRLTMQPDIHLLASAYSATERGGTGRDEPVAWTVNYGRGRMFQTMLGHSAESMAGTGFAVLVQRGTEWAATGQVTLPAHQGALALSTLASPDPEARYALKNRLIAQGAAALPALFDAYAVGDQTVREEARATLLWVVQRWAGTPSRGDEIATALLHYIRPDQPLEVRRFALILVGLAGREDAAPQVARLLGDEEVAEAARDALRQLPGRQATLALASALGRTQGADKGWLLQALGARRDAAALSAVLAAAKDGDEGVRIEALKALGRIASPQARGALLEAAKAGSPAARSAALDAYLRVADALLERSEMGEAQAMYTEALGLAGADPLRMAALVGLGRVGDPRSLDVLKPFLSRGDPRLRATAAAAIGRLPGAAATRALAEAVATAPPEAKSALLAALAERADPATLAVVIEAAGDGDEGVRIAALNALAAIGEAAAAPALEAARAADSERVRAAAVEASLRVGDREFERGQAEAAAALYRGALDAATSDDQRTAALYGIGRVAGADSLPRVTALLEGDRGPVFEAALDAYVAIGKRLAASGEREQAVAVLDRALGLLPGDSRAIAVAEELQRLGVGGDLGARQGFVTQWWVIGPFPNPGGAAFKTAYVPEQEIALDKTYEQDGKALQWQAYHTGGVQGTVPFDSILKTQDAACAYAYAELSVGVAQDVLVKIGSNDDVVCWLNGSRIHANQTGRGLQVDDDVVRAHLEAGVNRILLKVLNRGSAWAACLRIANLDGYPVEFEARAP